MSIKPTRPITTGARKEEDLIDLYGTPKKANALQNLALSQQSSAMDLYLRMVREGRPLTGLEGEQKGNPGRSALTSAGPRIVLIPTRNEGPAISRPSSAALLQGVLPFGLGTASCFAAKKPVDTTEEKTGTVRLKILPERPGRFTVTIAGHPLSAASVGQCVTVNDVPAALPENGKMEILIPNRNGSYSTVHFPKEIAQRLCQFVHTAGPRASSIDLVHALHGQDRPLGWLDPTDWAWRPLKTIHELAPGTAVMLTPFRTLAPHLKKEITDTDHCAIHLANGYFLSRIGPSSPIVITDLQTLKTAYEARHAFTMTPECALSAAIARLFRNFDINADRNTIAPDDSMTTYFDGFSPF